MQPTLSIVRKTATAIGVRSAVKSDVDDENWFSEAALELYPQKPGTALHLISLGLADERLCQKYAAGSVKPGSYFLRRILRSPHGEPWLAATMEGCTERWWLDLEAARHLCINYQIVRRE